MALRSGLMPWLLLLGGATSVASLAHAQVYVEQVTPSARPSHQAKVFITLPDSASLGGDPDGRTNGVGGSVFIPVSPGGLGSASSVVQNGTANRASVIISGAGNVTTQIQSGVGNQSSLAITGANNVLSSEQNGNANASGVSLAGNNNTISSTQIGTGSSYILQHVGNGQSISVTQVR